MQLSPKTACFCHTSVSACFCQIVMQMSNEIVHIQYDSSLSHCPYPTIHNLTGECT